MTVHIWNFDKDIKIEGKNFYMPSGKLKVGSTAQVEVTNFYMPSGKLKVGSMAHVEVTKKTTTNNIFKNL